MSDMTMVERVADAEAFVRRALSHFKSNATVSDADIRAAALKVLKALPPSAALTDPPASGTRDERE